MTISDTELAEIVGRVVDPELRRDLHTMGMLRGASLAGGNAHVLVALPADDWPARSELVHLVEEAVTDQNQIESVSVEFVVMDEAEQAAVRDQLIGDPSSTGGTQEAHGHAEGRAVPFAEPGNPTRVLLIASGKGGVGKSSVTANLAIALAQRDLRTAVIDADVWGFSIPRMLGVERPPTVIDQMVIPVEANGVRCISMGFFAREDQPVIWRGPMLHKALEQFLTDVHWDDPDYLLIDLPPGTGDISLSIAQFLPKAELIVVTTPQPAAQKVAQRAAYMAEKVNLQIRAVERDIELHDLTSRSVDGGVSVGDIHRSSIGDDVVEFELQNTVIGEISKVQGKHRRCERIDVNPQSCVEVVADQGPVGEHQLSAFLDGDA